MKRLYLIPFLLVLSIAVSAAVIEVPEAPAWMLIGAGSVGESGASCTGNYGSEVEGTSNEGGASNYILLGKVTLDCSSSSYTVYQWGANSYEEQYKILIYSDTGSNHPGSLVVEGDAVTTESNENDIWLSTALTESLSSGDYWIGVIAGHHGIKVYSSATTGGNSFVYTAPSFAGPADLTGLGSVGTKIMNTYIGF